MLFAKKTRKDRRQNDNRRATKRDRRRRSLESLESRKMMATDLDISATFAPLPVETVELSVVNGGFEDISGETPYNEFTFGALNGWDVFDPTGTAGDADGPSHYIGTLRPSEVASQPGVIQNFAGGAPEGERVGIAFNYGFSGDSGEYGMQQTLAATLQADTTYTLSVDVGNIATGIAQSGQTFYLDGMPGYRVDLMAGDTVIASDNNSLDGLIPEGEFANTLVSFSVGEDHDLLGQQLGIRLVNLNDSSGVPLGNDLEVDFDNVQLFATTLTVEEVEPEPVLLVISNQDFWYQDYADALAGLTAEGVDVVVAAATTDIATPQSGSGYGADGGLVTPDIALADADADDYSAIVFSGGWGMSVYQYSFAGQYNNGAYNGSLALRTATNDLINDFVDQDKFVSGLCYGTTVLAYAEVDGMNFLEGRNVTGWQGWAPGTNTGWYSARWHVEDQGGIMADSGSIGDPSTSEDDVIIDGNIITGENMFSAFYLGQVLGQQVNPAAVDAAFEELGQA